ncbi:prepilin-type N-terminal cleavage/methylation domain-containing protein [Trichococcus flocculiformis]|uniref:competence type IV pilus major pilin ComGC n=1 Tax=Trichococcus TaxID=82802 RepID=UPI0007A90151|nr:MULTISPECIES: type II secretion system protein [Trichococcus]CZQ85156.1 type iv pilin n-term methylation site gfxxxe [Trichococcus sp. ES5]SHF29312.1 prepilin-type N-terminal cleavage/methylation domain-containing protein [Trichococcus flocculiformis]
MRNKIKQLLKKEGGFTLVELLAVIAILGFIVAISIPLVGNVVSKAKTDTEAQQQELVIDAAQMYFLQEKDPVSPVDIATLKNKGYLEKKYKGTSPESITKAQAEAGELTTTTP